MTHRTISCQKRNQISCRFGTLTHDPPCYLMALTRPQSEGLGCSFFYSYLFCSLSIPGHGRHVVLRITICPREKYLPYTSISFHAAHRRICIFALTPGLRDMCKKFMLLQANSFYFVVFFLVLLFSRKN